MSGSAGTLWRRLPRAALCLALGAAVTAAGPATRGPVVTGARATADVAGPAATTCSATAYATAVTADSPTLWYQLNESSGTVAHDSSAAPHNGTYQGGVTYGVAGPTDCGAITGVTLDGSTGYVSNANVITSPAVFSIEIWFKTKTDNGGMLLGFGNMVTGASTNYDRHIYMSNSGQIYFGVSSNQTVHSAPGYNDGAWHQAVGTLGPAGLDLYIDGSLVASNPAVTASSMTYPGSWRVGYDSLGGWDAHPHSNFFGGSVAEASVYGTQLSAARVAAHYAAATNPTSGLTLAKSASVTSAAPGGAVGYTITATNTGLIPLTGATFTDAMADVLDDATYNGDAMASTGTVTFTSPNLIWTGSLAVGATATVTYSVTVNNPVTGNKSMVNTVTSTTAGSNCSSTSLPAGCSVTVPVVTGVLSVTAPSSAGLGSGSPGGTVTGALGTVAVTDNRALAAASWTATVSASSFTTGTATAAQTIPAGDAFYDISGLTATTGTATFAFTPVTNLAGTAQSVVTATNASGSNSASWKPTVVVNVPAGAVAGSYTGTITDSVS
ncbi:MAG TPA: LamG-like jellyroll fold domain-containing protein [Streptosporangiaceae bacterium]|nr:LamG-like jellyroll fold domain-containing protein [Streptosporangiaceae bacterium]